MKKIIFEGNITLDKIHMAIYVEDYKCSTGLVTFDYNGMNYRIPLHRIKMIRDLTKKEQRDQDHLMAIKSRPKVKDE